MLDNCEPDSRQNIMFDDNRLHIMHDCSGFTSKVDRDGIEYSRTQCEGTIDWVFDIKGGETPDAEPFTQEQWSNGELKIVEVSRYELAHVRRFDPETGEVADRMYTWFEEYTDGHLSYGR